ncbi:hypothetical protein [Candidatus Regiella endosymbiont of Tuberolachnus salignus]|uniref:hypothetical protein n=1 Tax=Candidatus Regiella endosymbiont of Tuberolachnus salignus TaxID=3077956 RepID=UPI0030CD6B3C
MTTIEQTSRLKQFTTALKVFASTAKGKIVSVFQHLIGVRQSSMAVIHHNPKPASFEMIRRLEANIEACRRSIKESETKKIEIPLKNSFKETKSKELMRCDRNIKIKTKRIETLQNQIRISQALVRNSKAA